MSFVMNEPEEVVLQLLTDLELLISSDMMLSKIWMVVLVLHLSGIKLTMTNLPVR